MQRVGLAYKARPFFVALSYATLCIFFLSLHEDKPHIALYTRLLKNSWTVSSTGNYDTSHQNRIYMLHEYCDGFVGVKPGDVIRA